jgi:hypothetical protein
MGTVHIVALTGKKRHFKLQSNNSSVYKGWGEF